MNFLSFLIIVIEILLYDNIFNFFYILLII